MTLFYTSMIHLVFEANQNLHFFQIKMQIIVYICVYYIYSLSLKYIYSDAKSNITLNNISNYYVLFY